MMSKMLFISIILLVASLQYNTTVAKVYYVRASGSTSNKESLDHYLNNAGEYFSSYSQLRFKPGKYYLNTNNLVIQNVRNFALIGESPCYITCISYSSVIIYNVTKFTLKNINFQNCNKNHSANLHTTFTYDDVSITKPSHNTSVLFITVHQWRSIISVY